MFRRLAMAAFWFWAAVPLMADPVILLLEKHLELASEGRPYLLLEPRRARVFIQGIEVKILPFESHWRFLKAHDLSARVARLVPSLPEKLVMACSECDDPSSTAGVDDRIGIEEMPANFIVALSDGSYWLVLSERDWWPASHWKRTFWRWRVLIPYLASLVSSDGEVQLAISQMEPHAAQTLYWILQPGMGVLRSEVSLTGLVGGIYER